MALLYYVSYLAIVAAFVFVTLSLASGLLYVSELIEEHTRMAKVVGQRGIYVIILLHVLFYFFDSLPLLQTTFSITCHIVYLQNFSSSWPLISLTSPSFLASCALVIADHFIWFFYFAQKTNEARHLRTYRAPTTHVPGFTEIASFFGICVWLAPLFLFLSLSANENALPVSSAEPTTAGIASMQTQQAQSRVSLIRSMLSFLTFDKLPGMKAKRRDTAEGLLAPHTPNRPRTPTSHQPASPLLTPSQYAPLPRSPGPRAVDTQELDIHFSPTVNHIKLSAPPRRSSQGPIRRTTGDSTRVGQLERRVLVSPFDEDDVFKNK